MSRPIVVEISFHDFGAIWQCNATKMLRLIQSIQLSHGLFNNKQQRIREMCMKKYVVNTVVAWEPHSFSRCLIVSLQDADYAYIDFNEENKIFKSLI